MSCGDLENENEKNKSHLSHADLKRGRKYFCENEHWLSFDDNLLILIWTEYNKLLFFVHGKFKENVRLQFQTVFLINSWAEQISN